MLFQSVSRKANYGYLTTHLTKSLLHFTHRVAFLASLTKEMKMVELRHLVSNQIKRRENMSTIFLYYVQSTDKKSYIFCNLECIIIKIPILNDVQS